MHVFVTGAAGFNGKAAVSNLIAHGHTVLGLARTDANATILEKLGASVHRGSLTDHDSLRTGAAQCDGILHLAFMHDFSDFERICRIDREAMTALADGLEQSHGGAKDKPFVIISGTLALANPGPGKLADEDQPDRHVPGPLGARTLSRELLWEFNQKQGIRGTVVRFTPNVHAPGDQGFGVMLIRAFRDKGAAYYIGDGFNPSWPGVHRDDVADLLRRALEKGEAGKTYHAVAEEAVSLQAFAELAGRKLDIPVKGVSVEEAQKELGFLGFVIAANTPVSSEKTRRELGWTPKEVGYLEDVERYYFDKEVLDAQSKY